MNVVNKTVDHITACKASGKEEKTMARVTKAQVYAAHGITFKADHIMDPDGRMVPLLLKDGNSKVGVSVLTWSLPAGANGTCNGTCPGCYALTGQYNRPNVKACLAYNLYLVNKYPDFVKRAIIAQIHANGTKEVRIHAAGDFKTARPAEYAQMWVDIAQACPETGFWTYTKMHEFESIFDGVENANIVKSIIPGHGFNYGHCEHIIRLYEILTAAGENVYICRCGMDKNQHCENCKHCLTSKYVLFLEHSTDYIAEKDPLYKTLCEIIDAQGK